MARDLGHSVTLAAAVLVLHGCGDAPSPHVHRSTDPGAAHSAAQPLAWPAAGVVEPRLSRRLEAPAVLAARLDASAATDDSPPWLAELLRAPDPNVRIQGLDAWAHQPDASLDPLTYALVDPDESVRAHAEELVEQALARRREETTP